MRSFETSRSFGLTVLFVFCGFLVCAQTNNSNDSVEDKLIGIWGMYKDKHPDGWGSFKTPYMYYEFMENGSYNRIFLHRKRNSIFFGTYEVVNDSLIILNESIGTNGIEKGPIKANTVRLYTVQSDSLELWEDWDRILWKSIKKWGHKQKYRPLTAEEKQEVEVAKKKLMNDYALIK